jgi:ribokinase
MTACIVVGSVHIDLIARAGRLPRQGETLPGTSFAIHPGGKGGNQAAQVARAGVPAVIVGRVGRDQFGERLRAALRDAGVDTTYLAQDDHEPTGASTVLVGGDGDYASVIVPGAGLAVRTADIDTAVAAMPGAAVVLLQLEIAPGTVAYAAARARARGATVILNAAPVPERPTDISRELWGNVGVVVANRVEAEMLAGEAGDESSSDELAARIRATYDVDTVIVTLGGEGVVLADGAGSLREAAWPVEVVETIGAGDAFVGMLAATMARGTPARAALTVANAAGALAVTRSGGYQALPTRAEVERFLAERGEAGPALPC